MDNTTVLQCFQIILNMSEHDFMMLLHIRENGHLSENAEIALQAILTMAED